MASMIPKSRLTLFFSFTLTLSISTIMRYSILCACCVIFVSRALATSEMVMGGDSSTHAPDAMGRDPSTWSPTSKSRPIGGDPSTWSPSSAKKKEPSCSSSSDMGRPIGGDPSTWSPSSAKKNPHRIGGDPSTWTPKPSKENNTAACPSQQDTTADLGCLSELQNLLKHELELQGENLSNKGSSNAKHTIPKNNTTACHDTNVSPIEPSLSEKCTNVDSQPSTTTQKLPPSNARRRPRKNSSKPQTSEETAMPSVDKESCKKSNPSSSVPESTASQPQAMPSCGASRHFAHECYMAAQKKNGKTKTCKYTDKLTPPDTEKYDDDVLEQCDPSGFPGKHFYHGRWIWSTEKDCWQWEQGRWILGRDKKCQFVRGKWGFISEDDATILSNAFPKGLNASETAAANEPLASLRR